MQEEMPENNAHKKTDKKVDKAEQTKQRILDAAARLFKQSGYASVSLRAIADAANMKAGSVYYHFESKEKIVIDVLNIGIEKVYHNVKEATNQLLEEGHAEEIITTGILAHLAALFEYSDYTSANVRIYGQVPPEVQHGNLSVRRQYEKLWHQIFQHPSVANALAPNADIKTLTRLIIGALNATLEWFDPKEQSLDDLGKTYSSSLIHGLLR